MSIRYAILGFLSWRPMTGYDLKKMFADSAFIYWSGNNNQIYRTLVGLHRDELVTSEVQHQETGPTRKVYTITEKGSSELRDWVLSSPELPQLRNTFLIRLAWADQLEPGELDTLLETYEHEVHMGSLMAQEEKRRNRVNPARTGRESYLWDMISDNWIAYYENEVAWVRKVRKELGAL